MLTAYIDAAYRKPPLSIVEDLWHGVERRPTRILRYQNTTLSQFASAVPSPDDVLEHLVSNAVINNPKLSKREKIRRLELRSKDYRLVVSGRLYSNDFYPRMLSDGFDQARSDYEARYNKECGLTLDEMKQDPYWRAIFDKPCDRVIVFGIVGLAYECLISWLERSGDIKRCLNCGAEITGAKQKKFCSQSENASCYAERSKKRKRISRMSS